jgi:hypothetical protein
VPETLGAMRYGWNFFTTFEGITLPQTGYYQMEILIGGEPKIEVPLNVIEIEDDEHDGEE